MILANHGIVSSSGASGDTDALAFITAASITDNTQKTAINTLVTDLKGYNIWSKMKALYPFVGGTATSHKFNLKDPRDLDAAFRLTFNGGGTHSSTGYLTNNVNSYANTWLTPSANQSLTSGHFSLYSRTSESGGSFAGSGIRDNSDTKGVSLCLRRSFDNLCLGVMYNEGTGGIATSGTTTDARGFYQISRISNNSLKLYKNSTSIASNLNTQSATLLSSNTYYIGGINDNNSLFTTSVENKEFAFSSIGDGLSDAEAANFYTAVQLFNTTLSRNV